MLVEASELEAAKDYVAAAENAKLYPEERKVLEEAQTKLIVASASPSPAESAPPNEIPPL